VVTLIPGEARRKHVSVIVDPASGTVSIILDNLELKWQNVLGRASDFESLAPRQVKDVDSQLVGASWMGLLQTGLQPSRLWGSSQRMVVDSSMRFESRGIKCDWEGFLFLALGLGVDLYRGRLQDILASETYLTLEDTNGRAVMNLQNLDDGSWSARLERGLSFSERRAMAVAGVMMLRDRKDFIFVPLAQSVAPASHGTADFRKIPDPATVLDALTEAESSDNLLGLALTWTFYLESIFYGEGRQELLHVPQFVLKAREDSLADLRAVDSLRDVLTTIFPDDGVLVERIAASAEKEWNSAGPNTDGAERKGREPLDWKQCPTYVDLHERPYDHPLFISLLETFNPSPSFRADHNIDLDDLSSPAAVAARIILSTSIVQVWRREDWTTVLGEDGIFKSLPSSNPLRRLLHDEKDRPRKMDIFVG
jgi:hypothetical protein